MEAAARTGFALGGTVNAISRFDRKHYFYADLPHGYQITQQEQPIVSGGSLAVDVDSREQPLIVRLERIQVLPHGSCLSLASLGRPARWSRGVLRALRRRCRVARLKATLLLRRFGMRHARVASTRMLRPCSSARVQDICPRHVCLM